MSGRILVVDGVATNRIAMKAKLGIAQYEVIQACSTQEAHQAIAAMHPDVVLIDLKPDDQDGIDFIHAISKGACSQKSAVLALCAPGDTKGRIAALTAGADSAVSKPIEEMTLLARLRNLLRNHALDEEMRLRDSTNREFGFAEGVAQFDRPARIALLSGKGNEAQQWKPQIESTFGKQVYIQTADQALNPDEGNEKPDIYIVPATLKRPDDGLRMLSELRSRTETRHAAVLIVFKDEAAQQTVVALDLGANDVIQGDVVMEEMALRLKAMLRGKLQSDHLRSAMRDHIKLATIDPLTGLYNRRYAFTHLTRIRERSADSGGQFALMILDIDRFKRINDNYGHATGDRVLKEVSSRLHNNLRSADLLARIGGEEFLIAMPETDLIPARGAAERLRRVIEETPVRIDDGPGDTALDVTLSIGVTIGGAHSDADLDTLIAEADTALYESKTVGRNTVTFCKSAA